MEKMTDYQRSLVEDHLNVVDWVIRHRIDIPNLPLMTYEDFYQIGCEALCRAAMAYRPEKGEFSPLAATCVYNAIIEHIKGNKNQLQKNTELDIGSDNEICSFKYFSTEPEMLEHVLETDLRKELQAFKKQYSGIVEKGIEVMELRCAGYSCEEICALFHTNSNNINAWVTRARIKMMRDPDFRENYLE